MSETACGLCKETHEVRGVCPAREFREEMTPVLVAVERMPLPEWRNDHGVKCTCLACVVARGERRIAAQKALLERRKSNG